MSYLVMVGAIAKNKSGIGARGYHIFRRGHRVIMRWAGLEVVGDRGPNRFRWNRKCQELVHRYGSVPRALEEKKAIISRLEREGYHRLPPGIRIR